MSLESVGLCGIDEGVAMAELVELAEAYPRIEFGVLIHPEKMGQPRYPRWQWIEKLPELRLAAHLCGSAVNDVLQGDTSILHRLRDLGFARFQLNATKRNGCTAKLDPALDLSGYDVIIQANDETRALWDLPGVSLLIDSSCGTGKKVDVPALELRGGEGPIGIAGGLNAENVKDVLREIRKKLQRRRPFWIDMESGLRDANDRFDLQRAWAVCRATEPQVRVSGHAVLSHKVTLLRDRRTKPREFRTMLKEITFYLGYEATKDLPLIPRCDITAPTGFLLAVLKSKKKIRRGKK